MFQLSLPKWFLVYPMLIWKKESLLSLTWENLWKMKTLCLKWKWKKNAWILFIKLVVTGLLKNEKGPNNKTLVTELLRNYKILGYSTSIKVYFLHSHLNYFPESLGAVREEQKWPFTSRYKINGVKISRSM